MARADQGKVADPEPLPANLLQAFSVLFVEHLDCISRLRLRQTCRVLRDVHDRAALCIGIGTGHELFPDQFLSVEEVLVAIRGAVGRGCRPKKLTMSFRATSEEIMLAFLDSLAGVHTVESINLSPTKAPLTDALVHNIASSFPNLSNVTFFLPASPETADAGHQLLQLVGHKLTGLSLHAHDGHWPAPSLTALARCTSLTQLDFNNDWAKPNNWPSHKAEEDGGLAAESALLRTLSSLTSLRSLRLTGGAEPPGDLAIRQSRAAGLESCLSALTGLTSLDLDLHCLRHASHSDRAMNPFEFMDVDEQVFQLQSEGRADQAAQLLSAVAAESRAVVAATQCMPQLKELRTWSRFHAADLAALTTLTYLRVGAIVTLPVSNDLRLTPEYDLPPALELLKMYAPLPVRLAALLQRAPSVAAAGAPLISWQAPGVIRRDDQPYWTVEFSQGDCGDQGRLTAEAVTAMHRAVTNLKAAFRLATSPASASGVLGLHLRVLGTYSQSVRPPTPAAAAGAAARDTTHCGSWLGAMMAKLRPQKLDLWGFTLSPRDMLGMARCMAGLKVLNLRGSQYSVSALPLLGGLVALQELQLFFGDWEWGPDADADQRDVLEAAFLGLTAPAPRTGSWLDEEADVDALYECKAALPLPQLVVLFVYCESGPEEDWLREGLGAADAELQRRRPQPADLIVSTARGGLIAE